MTDGDDRNDDGQPAPGWYPPSGYDPNLGYPPPEYYAGPPSYDSEPPYTGYPPADPYPPPYPNQPGSGGEPGYQGYQGQPGYPPGYPGYQPPPGYAGYPGYQPPPGYPGAGYPQPPVPPARRRRVRLWSALGALALVAIAVVVLFGSPGVLVTTKLSHTAVEGYIEQHLGGADVVCNDGHDITIAKGASVECSGADGAQYRVTITRTAGAHYTVERESP